MKLRSIARIIASVMLLVSSGTLLARERLNFNNDWAFMRGKVSGGESSEIDDRGWIPVTIPHIMQLEKKHCGGNVIYDGEGWYRRYFNVDAVAAGKRVAISFEGVMTNCEVFLNGERIAEHHGGYLGFLTDITDKVKFGEKNLLAVRVDASHDPLTPPGKPQSDMDFYYYSGIYRDVELIVTDRLYVTDPLEENMTGGGGVFVTYPSVDSDMAVVKVDTHIRSIYATAGSMRLVTGIYDASGGEIASETETATIGAQSDTILSQTFSIVNPDLWHPESPYLYDVVTKIYSDDELADSVTTHVGIRSIAFDKDRGFLINGMPLYLRGANRHQAFPYVGDAVPNSMQEREVIRIKQGGFNAVRAAHYPHDPAFLDACDRYGLLVVECIPGWQYFNSDPIFSERVCEAGSQMIRRDRNHPSVILWEMMLNESRYPVALAEKLYNIAHMEYPGDQMYTSGDYFGHEDMAQWFDVLYKQVGAFPSDGNVMTNSFDDLIAIKPVLTREWGDGVGDKPRVSLGEPDGELLRQCYSRMSQLEGEGYFDWCMLDANPNMCGHFLWSYHDYTRGSQDETMFSGVVDLSRFPKTGYYMMQSMIAPPAGDPMVYIARGHLPEEDSVVTVFSNADEVRLFVDNEMIGSCARAEASREFPNVTARGGAPFYRFIVNKSDRVSLRAEATVGGEIAAVHELMPVGDPHELKVEFALEDIKPVADGSDLIPVYVTVCDVNGNRIHSWRQPISFTIEGEADIVGDSIERLGINPQMPDGGMAFVFLRTRATPGTVRLVAASSGLKPGEASTEVMPYVGKYVASCNHLPFTGSEEDGVVVKASSWQYRIMKRKPQTVMNVAVSSGADSSNIVDGDDRTWWIAGSGTMPQMVTLDLGDVRWIEGSRVMFQKDSSSYDHIVETSLDGNSWESLYDRECTGWDYKPMPVNRELRYFRVTFRSVSEGRAGINEITLF